MEKCEKCSSEIKNGSLFGCRNCGTKFCEDCANKNFKICPKCYYDMEILG